MNSGASALRWRSRPEADNADVRCLIRGETDESISCRAAGLVRLRPDRSDGHVVVAVDRNRVAHFRRLADGRPLAPGETALRYRIRGGRPRFATDAFFFEEGQADAYAAAQYGEFRVGPDGDMILTALRDSNLRRLGSAC